MNRIILIGNGFDLAHGLKTSYADFINWYWEEFGKKLLESKRYIVSDEFISIGIREGSGISGWDYVMFNCIKHSDSPKEILQWAKTNPSSCFINCKSKLFSSICDFLEGKKWVDIENIYYQLLKEVVQDVKKINDDLDIIKHKLIDYLSVIENCLTKDIINQNILNHMYCPLKKDDIAISSSEYWNVMVENRLHYDEHMVRILISSYYTQPDTIYFNSTDVNEFIKNHSIYSAKGIKANEIPDSFLLPNKTMILNFNYTSTADYYFPHNDNIVINHIHGSLSNPDSVIFGYGDELDENYKTILNKNDNEYLRNIKSIKYLEAPNYRQLLEFIESDVYQIYIMGHSCGNSDRTLLNTLFEHKNCVSIKPFYHKKSDGTDNYIELVQNISRNFTDMKLMRDRVVNKTFCEPLS